MRAALENAAKSSGRSLSQEAELRLEQSFLREGLLPEVLSWAYDRQLAGIMLAIAETMKSVGPLTRTVGYVRDGQFVGGELGKWDESDNTKRQAGKAAKQLIDLLMLPERVTDFEEDEREPLIIALGEQAYGAVMLALLGIRGEGYYATDERWQTIRELLGPIADELKALKGKSSESP